MLSKIKLLFNNSIKKIDIKYIKINLILIFFLFFDRIFMLLTKNVLIAVILPIFTIPIIYYKSLKHFSIKFLTLKLFLLSFSVYLLIGWSITIDIYEIRETSEVYYFFSAIIFQFIVFVFDHKFRIYTFFISIVILLLFSIYVYLLFYNGVKNNSIGLNLAYTHILIYLHFIVVLNSLVFNFTNKIKNKNQ